MGDAERTIKQSKETRNCGSVGMDEAMKDRLINVAQFIGSILIVIGLAVFTAAVIAIPVAIAAILIAFARSIWMAAGS